MIDAGVAVGCRVLQGQRMRLLWLQMLVRMMFDEWRRRRVDGRCLLLAVQELLLLLLQLRWRKRRLRLMVLVLLLVTRRLDMLDVMRHRRLLLQRLC